MRTYLSIVIDNVYLHIVWPSPSASLNIIVMLTLIHVSWLTKHTSFLADQTVINLLAQLHRDQD